MRSQQEDVWISCPECHNIMVPLRSFEIQSSEGPTVDFDPVQFLLFGWWSIIANFCFGAARMKGRQTQLAKEKAEVLPSFPNSQICPRCFHVTRRP